jgi:hypothetical protein
MDSENFEIIEARIQELEVIRSATLTIDTSNKLLKMVDVLATRGKVHNKAEISIKNVIQAAENILCLIKKTSTDMENIEKEMLESEITQVQTVIEKNDTKETKLILQQTAEKIMGEILFGRVYKYEIGELHHLGDLINVIIFMFQEANLTKNSQLEALGGCLCSILEVLKTQFVHVKITKCNWDFLIRQCTENSDLQYFVACVLFTIVSCPLNIKEHEDENVYNMLVLFTKKYNAESPPLWTSFLFLAWYMFFTSTDPGRTHTFYSDIDLVQRFLLLCRCRKMNILTSSKLWEKHPCVFVQDRLRDVIVPLHRNETILDIVYDLMKRDEILREMSLEHWPFMVEKENQIIDIDDFKTKVEELNENKKKRTYDSDEESNLPPMKKYKIRSDVLRL